MSTDGVDFRESKPWVYAGCAGSAKGADHSTCVVVVEGLVPRLHTFLVQLLLGLGVAGCGP